MKIGTTRSSQPTNFPACNWTISLMSSDKGFSFSYFLAIQEHWMKHCMPAYSGRDMENDGVAVNIPHKPHPYGVLNYLYNQILQHTRLPITVDFEPRLQHNKLSPFQTFQKITARLLKKLPPPIHTIADSAFCC
jgi:hypothetical protein